MANYQIHRDLPALPDGFHYTLDLAPMATSKDLHAAPRHRWFYFKHSYSYRLVERIMNTWTLPEGSVLVDNFVGSGTTLLTAQHRGVDAMGYDLSPLAVIVANAKTADYCRRELDDGLDRILRNRVSSTGIAHYPKRIRDAFSDQELHELAAIFEAASKLLDPCRGFFLLAALSTAYQYSRAISDGGWLRWMEAPDRGHEVRETFVEHVEGMISDVQLANPTNAKGSAYADIGDARSLPLDSNSTDAVLTSPPYPNRHDYSRVFHIGLLLLGTPETGVKSLRYHSLRSHVEARAQDGYADRLTDYSVPLTVQQALQSLPPKVDGRVPRMITGYFEDLFLSLQEVARILRSGGRAAYVVGNVRHAGTMIPVDAALREIANMVGLEWDNGWVMRLRGNSAQQMGRYGKEPSRESVIMLKKA